MRSAQRQVELRRLGNQLPVFGDFCEGKVVLSTIAENVLGSLVPDADEFE